MTRRLVLGGALLATGLPLLAPAPASAAGPTSITVAGPGLGAPLVVRADNQPDLFTALMSQVSWLATRPGQTTAPKASQQGPKFTLVVYVREQAKKTYDLYPLAVGGPRAFRPAAQPDLSNTTSAWFFGRLNMSEVLRAAGVPLPARPDALSGGIGGGSRIDDESSFTPVDDFHGMLARWTEVYLLNAAVVVAIALGLAGFSLLIRRKI